MYTVYRDHITNKLDFMVKCTQAQRGQPSVNPPLKICRSAVRKQWFVAHLDFFTYRFIFIFFCYFCFFVRSIKTTYRQENIVVLEVC